MLLLNIARARQRGPQAGAKGNASKHLDAASMRLAADAVLWMCSALQSPVQHRVYDVPN